MKIAIWSICLNYVDKFLAFFDHLLWNCSRKYTKMFKTDSFLGNKKLSLNQNVWRDHATMQQDVLLHFWVIFQYWNQAEIWKKIFYCPIYTSILHDWYVYDFTYWKPYSLCCHNISTTHSNLLFCLRGLNGESAAKAAPTSVASTLGSQYIGKI